MKQKKYVPTWLVFAVSAGLCWGLWGVLAKFIAMDVNPYTSHLLFTVGMLFTLPFVIKKCKRSTLNRSGIFYGLVAACFAIAGNISVYYAFSSGGLASIVIPLTNLYPLITIVIAITFFKEKLNAWNITGLLLAVPAILLLSGSTLLINDPMGFFKSIGLNTWLLFSLGAVLCWGLFSAAQKVATNHMSAEWSYTIFIITSALISIGFFITGNLTIRPSNQIAGWGIIAGLLNGLGVLSSFIAYRSEGKASSVTTVAGALQPAFTIVLALIFLKEKFSIAEGTGLALALTGAFLLSVENKKLPAIEANLTNHTNNRLLANE